MTTPDFMPMLKRGSHSSPEAGACVMEYVSFITGDAWTDTPKCTPDSLIYLAQTANDALFDDDERSRLMLPLMPRLIGMGRDPRFDDLLYAKTWRDTKRILNRTMQGRESLYRVAAHIGITPGHSGAGLTCNTGPWLLMLREQQAFLFNKYTVTTSELAQWYHGLLLEALDLYDTHLGREKVEDLTDEQVVKVREVHEALTSA